MATIRECKNRLVTLLKIVDFFEENPFEQSFCGMSKRDALCLVQFYLKEQRSDISVLANLDFAQHVGTKFRDSFGNFEASLKMARTALAEGIDAVDNLPVGATPNLPIESTLSGSNIPVILPEIVQRYTSEVLNVTGTDYQPTRNYDDPKDRPAERQWALRRKEKWEKKGSGVFDPKTQREISNREILGNSFSQILNQQLAAEREAERVVRFNQQKTNLAGKAVTAAQNFSLASGQTLSEEQLHDMEKIFTDVVDRPVIDQQTKTTTKEAELWENFVLKNTDAASKAQDDFSQAKRETEVKNYYLNELVKSGVDKTMAGEIINQIGAGDLTEVSFLKYFRHLSTDPSLSSEAQQEKIGGLLAGKMMAAAHQAVNAPGFDPVKRSQLITDAVLETYTELANQGFSFLQAPDSVISQKLDEKLQKKFYQRAIIRGQNVTIAPIALDSEIALEAKELLSRQTAAVTAGEAGYHTLPIPGLVFLNEYQRIEVIANKNLLEVLKTNGKFDDVLLKFKDQRISQINNQLANAQKYKLTPTDIAWLLQKKAQLENAPSLITLQNNLLGSLNIHPTDEKKGFSPEELAFATKYIQTWQNMLHEHASWGWVINKIATVHSLQNSAIDSAVWGNKQYGQVSTFFRGMFMMPNIMAYQYIKAFLSAATQDFTAAPYYASVLIKSFIVGSVSLWAKTNFTRIVDRLIPSKLRGIFYVRDSHGMAHLTLLHPIEVAKVVWTKTWRRSLQWVINKAFVWVARFAGKEALAIALGGPIGVIFGAFWLIWDFLIPDWVKKALAWAAAGFIFLLINLWGLIWPILTYLLGPLGLAFGIFGLMIGGPIAGLLGAAIGMSLGTGLWIWFGWHTAPGWIMGLAPGWGGIIGGIGKGISSAWSALTSAPVVSAAGTTTAALIPVITVAGAGVASYLGITFLTTAMWTPVTPSLIPGGQIATDYQVKKTAKETNTSFCDFSAKKHCENDIAKASSTTEIEYEVQIQITNSTVKLTNIKITDEVNIIALGPNPPAKPTMKDVKKYTIPVLNIPAVSQLPDASGNNTASVKYTVNFKDEKYMNSYVSNLITVEANGQKATNGFSFTIGTPPPSMCPLLLGTITCGSIDTKYACHGLDSYWDYVEKNDNRSRCSYPIPVLDNAMKGSVSVTGISSAYCYNSSGKSSYGFATDIAKTVDATGTVYYPWVIGEDKISWQKDSSSPNGTYFSAYYTGKAPGGNQYKIYITHMDNDFSASGASGERLGKVCGNNNYDAYKAGTYTCYMRAPHLHIELAKNGQAVRPENFLLCE